MDSISPPMEEEHFSSRSPTRTTESFYRFQFHGTATEYFKIWFVNITLTILTLGIFSAWAKVRSNRYFYANTFLDGANFEYHAKPLSILVARLIILFIIVGGAVWAESNIEFNILYTTLFPLLFLPWALVRGLSFNARNSSYRNIRFHFKRKYTFPYIFNILMLFGIGVMIFPWLIRRYHKFKIENHQIGKVNFTSALPSVWDYIRVFLMFILLAILIVVFFIFLPVEAVVLSTLLIVAYIALIQATLFQLFWKGVRTKNGAIFQCNFSIWTFAIEILLVNFIASFLSLGLLYPWARVRKTRFLANNMYIIAPPGAMDEIFARHRDDESAFGEEFGVAEGFDFDVGLI